MQDEKIIEIQWLIKAKEKDSRNQDDYFSYFMNKIFDSKDATLKRIKFISEGDEREFSAVPVRVIEINEDQLNNDSGHIECDFVLDWLKNAAERVKISDSDLAVLTKIIDNIKIAEI